MSEARIGRLVAAALHESLAAHLPFRVEFYEHWLQPPRLKSGSVGMASFLAVLSFLRQEGDVYTTVVEDAGRHAAQWVYADAPVLSRLRWRLLTRKRRLRTALRLARRLSEESMPGTQPRVRWSRKEGRLQLHDSPFCSVRANVRIPLCGFYSSAVAQLCTLLDIPAHVVHETCRGMGAECCSIAVTAVNGASAVTSSDR
jgi:hypothetical protein